MDPAPPYVPAPHIVATSRLTAKELMSHFQDFSNTLRYIATAPELVFERLVGNLSENLKSAVEVQCREKSTVQQSQQAYDDLAAKFKEMSTALQASQVANSKISAELEEKSSALRVAHVTNTELVTTLNEKSSALHENRIAIDNLAADLEERSIALQACRLANHKLTGELEILTAKTSAPGPSTLGTVPAPVKRNPVSGIFGTSHGHKAPTQKSSRTVRFGIKYTTPPEIVVGLAIIDISHNANIRVKAYHSEIRCDQVEIHLDSWCDTKKLYGAACAWLAIEADDPDFQCGSYHTGEDHDWRKTPHHNTRQITFRRAYQDPPKVVVWLNILDLDRKANWRIKSFATHVTSTGFTMHIDSWSDTKLYSAMASWVAYPANRQGVASGSFSTLDIRPSARPQVKNSSFVAFGTGVFNRPPKVFLALNALDISCKQYLRIQMKADDVTAAGMTWHLDAWADTTLYSAGGSYIAFS